MSDVHLRSCKQCEGEGHLILIGTTAMSQVKLQCPDCHGSGLYSRGWINPGDTVFLDGKKLGIMTREELPDPLGADTVPTT